MKHIYSPLDGTGKKNYNVFEVSRMPVFRTEFKKAAMKYLAKLDRETQKSILTAIQGLSQIPPLGDLKTLG